MIVELPCSSTQGLQGGIRVPELSFAPRRIHEGRMFMSRRFSMTASSLNQPCRLICRGLLVLLTLSLLLAGTLTAQSDPATKRAEALKLVNEGQQLYQDGSKDSLKQAILKFEQARPLFHSTNDVLYEATTLNNIGLVYDSIGEKQKALDNYAQALPLSRAVGDRGGEATTLNNIGAVYDDLGEKQKALDNYALALRSFALSVTAVVRL